MASKKSSKKSSKKDDKESSKKGGAKKGGAKKSAGKKSAGKKSGGGGSKKGSGGAKKSASKGGSKKGGAKGGAKKGGAKKGGSKKGGSKKGGSKSLLNQARDIGHYIAAIIRSADHAQIRHESSERIIGDLRFSGRDPRNQSRFAGVWKTYQTDIGQELQFETELLLFPGLAIFVLGGRLVS